MTTSLEFCQLLKSHGFNFFTGVPDSTFKTVITILENDVTASYIPAVREDAAIGLATGAYLGGHRPMVLMQNSGLGVSINALASLPILYQIPMLVLIGWRGYQGEDAPEHLIMGASTINLLRDIGMPYEIVEVDGVDEIIARAVTTMDDAMIPTALILREGILK